MKLYRLILWDQRGHGKSSSPLNPDAYGIWQAVEDAAALLDALSIARAHMGGQSMGGGIATRFSLRYPERTASLIICNSHSASGLNSSPRTREMRLESMRIVREQGMQAMAEFAMDHDPNIVSRLEACSTAQVDVVREEIRHMFTQLNPTGYLNSIIAVRNSDDISSRLRDITVPTLLISGDLDPALPSMQFVHSQIQGSILRVLQGAGHHTNLDQPEAFNGAVLSFLNSQLV